MSQSRTGEADDRIGRLEEQNQRLAGALERLAAREAHHAPQASRGRDWGALAAVIASLIGLLALSVSAYAAYVQREQFRAEVWPRVELAYSTVNPGFSALNQGTGPALVKAMRITVGGATVRNWDDLAKAAGFIGEKQLYTVDLIERVLPAGKEFPLVRPADDEQSRAIFKELFPGGKHALSITVCYCSVLDDCWVASDVSRVKEDNPGACPIAAGERFGE